MLGTALGILFVALFVAASGPWNELLRRSDAVLPMLAVLANMSALFTALLFAAAAGERAANAGTPWPAVPARRRFAVAAIPSRRRAADSPVENV